MKEIFRIINLGIAMMLFPFVFSIYVLDRTISGIVNPRNSHPSFVMWCEPKNSIIGVLRVLIVLFLCAVIYIIRLFIY